MVTPQLRLWWLERFVLEEIVALAEAIWPTLINESRPTVGR